LMGKIGVSVSPANPDRVYAIIESPKGGLYRSDDAGESWRLINGDRVLHARSWYYMHVFAHPIEQDRVVVLNAPYLLSKDGGKSFVPIRTRHGDNHDLWFNPTNPDIQINANDGGANITYNGGKTWSTQSNQPTAQFYRVNADNRIPYYIYGGQQDNSSMAVPSRTPRSGISVDDFYPVGGCESAYTAFDPDDPEIVYAGCYQGIIEAYNTETRTGKDIMAYSFLGLGTQPKDQKYRFNWNAPILVSQHDPNILYHASNVLLKSENKGVNWEVISPDLSQNIEEHLGFGGGPITSEGAGGEVYHTIYYIAESSTDAKTIWAGTDDGLLHITRDGGKNWEEITPPGIGEAMINAIETSSHKEGTAYVAVNRYKFNDFTPHIFITHDFGKTWKRRVKGIAEEAHVRVVREDPKRKGLLYAGTETGVYISFDEGVSWSSFQLNLPIVPITDLKVHHNDLIAATQGRAFWVLDDLTPLHQLHDSIAEEKSFLFQARNPYLYGGRRNDKSKTLGVNPDPGAVFFYHLASDTLSIHAKIYNKGGELLRTIKKMPAKEGMNKWVWDLRSEKVKGIKGVMVIGGLGGYEMGPGDYKLKLFVEEDSLEQAFKILPDPRFGASLSQYQAKERALVSSFRAVNDLYEGVRNMRDAKKQISSFLANVDKEEKELHEMGEEIQKEISELELELIQPKQKTFQDVINFENKLDANLVHIMSGIDSSPPPLTQGQKDRLNDLLKKWTQVSIQIDKILQDKIPRFNRMISTKEIPMIQLEKE
ncbi:MAG: glycosyl hydrolase, partial [Bacteroidota bacterium]